MKTIKIKIFLVMILACNLIYGQKTLSIDDLTVLKNPADTMMRRYLTAIVDHQFAIRDSLLSTLITAGDWNKRVKTIRDSMISWTGPFPDRNPLNAKITGTLKRDGYTIEKILFESRPGFYVSANLYLPENVSSPRPAILNVLGHMANGKAADIAQLRSIFQAKKGFVALTIDNLGQGERQVADYSAWSSAPGNAHTITGIQAFVAGTNVFNIMVWDAIRAIDYLVSRPEVDGSRIGITGCSGGGMMTTYILPFEPRISVAVAACNPNTWSHRVHAGLSADHEQIIFGCFESAIDPRGDPLFAIAPKPLLINATTDDNLNPARGVWELSTWLYKAYSAYGAPEKFTTTMVEAGHGYNRDQREIAYSWFLKWMDGNSSDFLEQDIKIEKDEDLWATANGSTYDVPGSRQSQELVLDYLAENKAGWTNPQNSAALIKHKSRMPELVKDILRISPLNDIPEVNFIGTHDAGDFRIRKFIIQPEKGIMLPGILLEPDTKPAGSSTILYLSQSGKKDLLNDNDIVKELLASGQTICAVDLRGYGETAPDMAGMHWDFLSGKPIFGQRVQDILAIVNWLKSSEIKAGNIKIWGKGMGSLYSAFSGVLTDNIAGFVLEEPLISFESIIRVRVPGYHDEIVLPGILEKFDMPQVYQGLCPKPVLVVNPLSGDKKSVDTPELDRVNKAVLATYKGLRSTKNWIIQNSSSDQRGQLIIDFLQ